MYRIYTRQVEIPSNKIIGEGKSTEIFDTFEEAKKALPDFEITTATFMQTAFISDKVYDLSVTPKDRLKIVVTDIGWDTDGVSIDDLPEEVTIYDAETIEKYDMLADESGYADGIAEYLSDTYGYCLKGFAVNILSKEVPHEAN